MRLDSALQIHERRSVGIEPRGVDADWRLSLRTGSMLDSTDGICREGQKVASPAETKCLAKRIMIAPQGNSGKPDAELVYTLHTQPLARKSD